MKKSGKFKLSLLGSIGVSLLAVSTAAVSTFAWFRAEADVQVSAASSDPVSITVSKPDDINISVTTTLYSFNGNNAPGYIHTNENVTFDPTPSTGTFTEITDFATAIDGLMPGRSKTFCIKVHGDKSFDSLTLTLKAFSDSADNDTYKRYKMTNSTTASDSYLKMSEAIKFNGVCNTSGTFSKSATSGESLVANTTKITGSNLNNADVYFFYTLIFVDSEDTRYIEYNKVNSVFSVAYTTSDASTYATGNRYFLKDNTGNNSCFEGLSFTITQFEVSI
jgi:hypothetical protein